MLTQSQSQPVFPPIPEQRDALLADCRLFFAQHGSTLLDALDAVSGVPAVRTAAQLIAAVAAAPAWMTPFTRQLDRLYGILTLAHLDDPYDHFRSTYLRPIRQEVALIQMKLSDFAGRFFGQPCGTRRTSRL